MENLKKYKSFEMHLMDGKMLTMTIDPPKTLYEVVLNNWQKRGSILVLGDYMVPFTSICYILGVDGEANVIKV